MSIIAILLLGILDFLRGREALKPYTSKPITSALSGLVLSGVAFMHGAMYLDAALYGVITALGIYLGVVVGWGKYFAAFTGKYKPKEKDFFPADILGDVVFARIKNGHLAGFVGMSVRHILYYPLFVVLAAAFSTIVPMLVGLLCVFGAVPYALVRFIPEKYALMTAEFLRGCFIAALIVSLIW